MLGRYRNVAGTSTNALGSPAGVTGEAIPAHSGDPNHRPGDTQIHKPSDGIVLVRNHCLRKGMDDRVLCLFLRYFCKPYLGGAHFGSPGKKLITIVGEDGHEECDCKYGS